MATYCWVEPRTLVQLRVIFISSCFRERAVEQRNIARNGGALEIIKLQGTIMRSITGYAALIANKDFGVTISSQPIKLARACKGG